MLLCVWAIGKTKEGYFIESEMAFYKRIKHYYNFESQYFKKPKNFSSLPLDKLKEAEAEIVLSHLSKSDYLVLLDENGKSFDSRQFAKKIEEYANQSLRKVVFLIGGAYGFSDKLYDRANEKLSLSKMTFSHQLIRTIFMEQLYRACTIIKGESYHND